MEKRIYAKEHRKWIGCQAALRFSTGNQTHLVGRISIGKRIICASFHFLPVCCIQYSRLQLALSSKSGRFRYSFIALRIFSIAFVSMRDT